MKYAGVPLLVPTAEAVALAAAVRPEDVHAGLWAPHASPVPLGTLRWPWGASRWAEGWFLCTESRLGAIRQAIYPNGGYAPAPLVLDDGSRTVETSLWALTPRPLTGAPGPERLYLLVLVDDRYWWWMHTTGNFVASDEMDWQSTAAYLGGIAGIDISLPDVPEAFGLPAQALASLDERLPPVLDRLGTAIGRRLVRDLSGDVAYLTARQTKDRVAANRTILGPVAAGGPQALSYLDPVDDLPTVHPRTVRITFNRLVEGVPDEEPLQVDVNLSDVLSEADAKEGRWLDDVMTFRSVSRGEEGSAELDALARAWAAEWFLHRTIGHDYLYSGVFPWAPEGASVIEWRHAADGVYTRVVSRHEDIEAEFLVAWVGNDPSDIYNYYGDEIHYHDSEIHYHNTNIYITGGPLIFEGDILINGGGKFYGEVWLDYNYYVESAYTGENPNPPPPTLALPINVAWGGQTDGANGLLVNPLSLVVYEPASVTDSLAVSGSKAVTKVAFAVPGWRWWAEGDSVFFEYLGDGDVVLYGMPPHPDGRSGQFRILINGMLGSGAGGRVTLKAESNQTELGWEAAFGMPEDLILALGQAAIFWWDPEYYPLPTPVTVDGISGVSPVSGASRARWRLLATTGRGGGGSDIFVKASSTDGQTGYLIEKVTSETINISIEGEPGDSERVRFEIPSNCGERFTGCRPRVVDVTFDPETCAVSKVVEYDLYECGELAAVDVDPSECENLEEE